MKKLTKKLGMSTLALASVFALGFSAVNTVASNNVSTQASVSAMAYEGDIDSLEGVNIVEETTIPTFTLDGQEITGAKITINASTYEHNNPVNHYNNAVSYKITITMPTTYTYDAGDEDAFAFGISTEVVSNDATNTNSNVTWSQAFTHNANGTEADTFTSWLILPRVVYTWNASLFVNDSAKSTMNNETVNATTNPDGKTMEEVYSTTFNSWEYDAELVANPQFAPYFDNAEISYHIGDSSAYDATLSYSFDLHLNGFDTTRNNTTGANTGDFYYSGVVYIPYVNQAGTMDDTYHGYIIDVMPEQTNARSIEQTQTEGSDTYTTLDDIYSVTINLDLNDVSYMIVDETYNIGYNLGTAEYDSAAMVTDSTLGTTKQDERVNTVNGSILWADAYGQTDATNTNTANNLDVDMDGDGKVDIIFGGDGTVTSISEATEATDINEDGDVTDTFTADGTANYARYNTMNQERTSFSLTLGSYTTAHNGDNVERRANNSIRVLSKTQYNDAMSQYNEFIAGNPWGIDGIYTSVTAIVLASIFGVTTIGLGAYIVVNNNKAKKAKAHTSTTHSHDKK